MHRRPPIVFFLFCVQYNVSRIKASSNILFTCETACPVLQASRRFMWEYENASNGTAGLDLSLVDVVIEIGMVGMSSSSNPLYIHRLQSDSPAADAMLLASMNGRTLSVCVLHHSCWRAGF